jgi:hypothetical protein
MIRSTALAATAVLAGLTSFNAWAADPLPVESHKVLNSAQSVKLMFRPDYIEYVCGIKGAQPKAYLNVYFARNDGATQIRPGRCET